MGKGSGFQTELQEIVVDTEMTASVAIDLSSTGVASPVERARALHALIVEHANTAEKQGRMAEPVFQALKSAGLFRITVARRAGGEGAGMRMFVETAAEIARSCPGSGWAYAVLAATTGMAASLPDAQSRMLFSHGDELGCFVSSKTGAATPTVGGYRITGQWPYASGCFHSDWAGCGVVIHDEMGAPTDSGFAFINLSGDNVRIIEDWNVAGLSASGSARVSADGQFVSAGLVLRDGDLTDIGEFVRKGVAEARDYWPLESALTLVGPMLGAGEGMLEAVRQKMDDRPIIGWNYDRQSDSHLLLAMLGEAAMKVRSARMHIYAACDQIDVTAPTRLFTQREKVELQAGCGYAMRLLREAADCLLDIAGPGGFALSNPIQRFWRDLSIGSRHNALNAGLSLELLGRALTDGKSNFRNIQEF